MKKKPADDHRLDFMLSLVQEWTMTQPEPSASVSHGFEVLTHLRHKMLHSMASHKGLFRGFFPRMRDQAGGKCGIEDTATLMKKWKWKQ